LSFLIDNTNEIKPSFIQSKYYEEFLEKILIYFNFLFMSKLLDPDPDTDPKHCSKNADLSDRGVPFSL